jgi:hypothetical protein
MLVDAVVEPEVPVTLMVAVPLAEELADRVSVSPLTATVTPELELVALSVTAPLKPFTSVTVMTSVVLALGASVTAGEAGVSVKLPVVAAFTVTVIDVVAVVEPEVPVTLMVAVPLAEELADRVSVLPLTATPTPELELVALSVTAPLKPFTSVTVMASVALVPWVSVTADEAGASVKLPCPPPPQAVPLIAKLAGTALVTPFHVPLNPIPVKLPPAGMLPL